MILFKKPGRSLLAQYLKNLSIRWCYAGLLAFCASCASVEKTTLVQRENLIVLLNPELELSGDWEHRRLRRADTAYDRVNSTLGYTIRATGNESASILFRLFEPIDLNCNKLRWSWFVPNPQSSANLYTKGMDDVAASIFVMFGDPGVFRDKPVPTLKYVWTNNQHRPGEIIAGPYHKKYVRTVIMRAGSPIGQTLLIDHANIIEDYINAFGESPKEGIYGVAIFTDNDDTKEPIVAHYGRIELLCNNE